MSGGRERLGWEGRIPGTDMGMTGAASSGAASLSVPTLAVTPASMGHEPVMVPTCPSHFTPYLHYIVVTLLVPSKNPLKIFPFVLISLPLSILPPSSLISQLEEEVMSPN